MILSHSAFPAAAVADGLSDAGIAAGGGELAGAAPIDGDAAGDAVVAAMELAPALAFGVPMTVESLAIVNG